MESSSAYGSQNEETNFIRRVTAPDRTNSNGRQTKRLVLAGTALILVGASAGVGYATLQVGQSDATATPATQQMAASLEVPDFVDSMGDPYYPSFELLDRDGDGIVTYEEYMTDLNEVWAKNKEDIANSDLPEIVKSDLLDQLEEKITSDTACVNKAMVPKKKRALTFDKKTIDSLYYMLEVYCFDTPIEIPPKYIKMFPDTQAPVVPEPSLPAVQAPTSVDDVSKTLVIDTPQGPTTVTTDGPVIDDKQVVTITTADGSKSTTSVDVVKTTDGNTQLEIPTGPGGDTTTVTVPSTSTTGSNSNGFPTVPQTSLQSPQTPQLSVYTPDGPLFVLFNGPVTDTKVTATLTYPDGRVTMDELDRVPTFDGSVLVRIPTGPGDHTTVMTMTPAPPSTNSNFPMVPQTSVQAPPSFSGTGELLQLAIQTPEGTVFPLLVGPITDGKEKVTLIKPDDSKISLLLDVAKNFLGRYTVEVPIGPDDKTITVVVPQALSPGDFPVTPQSSYQEQTSIQAPPQMQVDTPQVPEIVTPVGPVIDDKQVVTITTADGSKSTTTVDVVKPTDGTSELEIPTGSKAALLR